MKASGATRPLDRDDRRLLLGLLAVAFVLRLCVVPVMGIHHYDELWQYLEPAYKLVTGLWVETWDFRDGIRSWLVPMAIAPAMWLGLEIDPSGLMHVYLPRVEMAILSLTIVWSAWKLGFRISRYHAAMAAFIAAIWAEFVHFAPRTMSEPIAVALLFPAFVLLAEDDKRKLALSGLLFGLAVVVRLQYAPIVALLALGGIWNRWERLPYVIFGGLAGLAIDGVADCLAGEVPFYWIVQNFNINVLQSKSAEYGTSPWYQYLLSIFYYWSFASGFIFVLAGIGARRFPVIMVAAIVNIVLHSLIPHKEYRFIYLSSVLIVFLAAIGTADAIKITGQRKQLFTKLACLIWLMSSAFMVLIGPIRMDLRGHAALLDSLMIAGTSPMACGLATYLQNEPPAAYTFYNRKTPIFSFKGDNAEREFEANRGRFNVVLTHQPWAARIGTEYQLDRCTGSNPSTDICVYRRKGGCTEGADSEAEINKKLRRDGD